MNIYINGFQLVDSKQQLAPQHLNLIVTAGIIEPDADRILVAKVRADVVIGMLFTRRDRKSILTWNVQSNQSGARVQIEKNDLGRPQADFNAFVIRQDSGIGLISQYRGSGGITSFGNVLKRAFRKAGQERASLIKQEHLESEEEVDRQELKRRIEEECNPTVMCIPMIKDAEFAKEVEKLVRIKKFHFRAPEPRARWYRKITDLVDKELNTIVLRKEGKVAEIRDFILGFVADQSIDEGSVEGSDSNDEDFKIPIQPDQWCFDKYDHDRTVIDETFNSDNLHNSPLIKKMLAIMKRYPRHFEKKV